MRHRGTDPANAGWLRTFTCDEQSLLGGARSNRLTGTAIGAAAETYSVAGDGYDAHGNMLRLPHLQTMDWDFKDQLTMTRRQAVNPEDLEGVPRHGERTWYVYDSTGRRVRKVTELAPGQIKDERIYLGAFENYRRRGANPLVRETLHLVDDKQRIALVETETQNNVARLPVLRYQLGDNLGAVRLELDEQARIIGYEEYTPFGGTSYQAVRNQLETPKRYRFTGMERDEENGFHYHGRRYYAPWLGRWPSCDPVGIADTENLYSFARNNPINVRDMTGLIGEGLPLSNQGVVPQSGDWGSVLPYNEQPKALYDAAGKRLTENEHIIPNGNLEAVTTDPSTGLSDYTKSQYRKDATVRVERSFALEKTAGNVAADNPSTAALKADVAQGRSVNYRDMVTARIENAKAARDRVGSAVTDEAIHRGALNQDGNLFGLQRLEESAKKITDAGGVIEDFDIVEHVAPAIEKTSTLSKALKVAGQVVEVGGGVLGSATGGWQVGTGLDELAHGKTGEGVINVAEGSVNLGMTIGVPALVKSGAVIAGGGAVAVTVVTLAATASVGLAAETARAAVKGEETPLDVADKFYGTHFGDIYGWATGAYSKH
jgi:RHS repeat-associated protein